jgi:hypothetical protein
LHEAIAAMCETHEKMLMLWKLKFGDPKDVPLMDKPGIMIADEDSDVGC